jgi:hypothetical protein
MLRTRPSADELWKLFSYDPVTGAFDILEKGHFRKRRGYLIVCLPVSGARLAVPTVIWAMMTGEYPKKTIDHEDLDQTNNRWINLREANHAQQQANRRLFKNNKSGYRGVYLQPSGRYAAYIRFDKKTHNLGTFDCPKEAASHDQTPIPLPQ